jgi:hypothetical protein
MGNLQVPNSDRVEAMPAPPPGGPEIEFPCPDLRAQYSIPCKLPPRAPQIVRIPGSGERGAGGTGGATDPADGRKVPGQVGRGDSSKGAGDSRGRQGNTKWSPVLPEALAMCRQGPKGWGCYGPGNYQSIFDTPSLEEALKGNACEQPTPAGDTTANGKSWQVFRCGHALAGWENDIAKRYPQVASWRRSYRCPADKMPGNGHCRTLFDGEYGQAR